MSAVSNQLFVLTILSYLVAMVAFAAENAVLKDDPAQTPQPPRPAPGGGLAVAEAPAPPRRRGLRFAGVVGVLATIAGAGAQTASVVARGMAADRVPWGNMYEFILVVCLVGVLAWLVMVAVRPSVRPLGLYVSLASVMLLALAGMRVYTEAGPLVPALNSYWLKIHVSTAAIATGIFLIGFLASALHLLRTRHDVRRRDGAAVGFADSLGRHLPSADRLERLSFRLHAVAFPVWTFAVLAGAVWAEAAWGRYWGWDPKETWAFISWITYAGYLHARATPSIRRTTTSWIAVAGWTTMMINLFAINLVVAGLHSYAGTD